MADWKTSLERLQRACANPREQLDRYLEQGKQVVGCFAPYAPEELVHAAGLIPMGMWGGRTELKLAKSYLPAFACPIMQANMELGLKGAYQGISAVIIPTMCDTLRCMTQNWRFGMKDIPMIPIVYPQNRTSPASVDYLISEFETVLTILYTITGNMVSEKSMEEAIAVYNQHNATMREFDTAANDHLDVITPKVRHVVHKSAFFFEKGEHTALVQEIIAGLKELPAHHWTGNKIILAGILCEPEEVLDILEENQLAVVADDPAGCGGRRSGPGIPPVPHRHPGKGGRRPQAPGPPVECPVRMQPDPRAGKAERQNAGQNVPGDRRPGRDLLHDEIL